MLYDIYSMDLSAQLASLNERQYQAVTASQVPLLVLAGAGSGKTRVLALRIGYLIAQGLVPAGNILALTFTNKAAAEMRGRVRALLGDTSATGSMRGGPALHRPGLEPVLSTFHSLGVRMLRLHGSRIQLPAGFSIVDGDDQQKVLKGVYEDLAVPESIVPGVALHFIHTVKNTGLAPEVVARGYRDYVGNMLIQIFAGYDRALFRQGVVDLDDLVRLPTRLLADHPDIRAFYQDLFLHVLVDEYQDTNPVQYQFLRLLCPPAALSVVGDDAQSIYGFRGSDITNILNFEKDFPDAQVVVLDQNYRSTVPILAVASAVLKQSAEQKPKELWTERPGGKRVVIQEFPDEQAEAAYIVESIINLANPAGAEEVQATEVYADVEEKPFSVLDYLLAKRSSGASTRMMRIQARLDAAHGPLSRYAVLYRTHAQSRSIESAFIAAGVPYRVVGGLRFFDRKEVKDALSFLRVLANPFDGLAWSRAASAVKRGVGERALEQLDQSRARMQTVPHAAEAFSWERLQELVREQGNAKLGAFVDLFAGGAAVAPDAPLDTVVGRILEQGGLIAAYDTGDPALVEKLENLREFQSIAQKYTAAGWREGLQLFLEEAALMTEGDALAAEDDAVTLLTLHAAKGLEFPVVFFAGLEEGLLPHSRSMDDPKALAEEVRLTYVGITRAQEALYMTYARQRGVFGETRLGVPSRFLRDLPEEAIQWQGRRARSLLSAVEEDEHIHYEPYDADNPF